MNIPEDELVVWIRETYGDKTTQLLEEAIQVMRADPKPARAGNKRRQRRKWKAKEPPDK